MSVLLGAIALTCPQTTVDVVGELLKTLSTVLGTDALLALLSAALQSDWFPAKHVPMEARRAFLEKLQQPTAMVSSFRCCHACTDFAKVCRANK